jgi:hypothetical protein
MWARVVEVMLGFWLTASPFIFRYPAEETNFWVNDLSCGFGVIALALLSFTRRFRYGHVAIAAIAIWLLFYGLSAAYPMPPASQNHILLGLLLLMFSIIPNEANLPPESWREPGRPV